MDKYLLSYRFNILRNTHFIVNALNKVFICWHGLSIKVAIVGWPMLEPVLEQFDEQMSTEL